MHNEASCENERVPEIISGNVYIRPNYLDHKGNEVGGHTHNFDHTTIVMTGSVHVVRTAPDGTVTEQDFRAPAHFLVKADNRHAITALEDNTMFWCVYSHRDPQGDVTQEYDGWGNQHAYA